MVHELNGVENLEFLKGSSNFVVVETGEVKLGVETSVLFGVDLKPPNVLLFLDVFLVEVPSNFPIELVVETPLVGLILDPAVCAIVGLDLR